jgi:hypothetical protein
MLNKIKSSKSKLLTWLVVNKDKTLNILVIVFMEKKRNKLQT